VQIKREADHPLIVVRGADGKPAREITNEQGTGDLLQVATAHFGLTLLRTEALRKLKHPWFLGHPDGEGRWGDARKGPNGEDISGRIDDDIHFWGEWEKAGNTIHQANRVKVGHLQQIITWPDKGWRARHQYINDYTTEGRKPDYAR
jgi:hypothetical protein